MRRIANISITSFMFIALVAGCANREVAKVDPNQSKEQFKDIPVNINRDIDILFVIDNSGSMAEEQVSLAQNFPRFINVLEGIEGGLPNVHIGVISTDLGAGPFNIAGCTGNGDNGTLQSTARGGTDPQLQDAFIKDLEDGNGGRIRNYSGDLASAFSSIAQLGTDGCGFEQQLEAMRRALNGSNATNAGFLRPEAYLAVIFVTDEDDCSTRDNNMFDTSQMAPDSPLGPLSSFRCFEFGVVCDPDDNPRAPGPRQNCQPRDDSQYMHPVQQYVDFLRSLKPDDPNGIIVAGIVGDVEPVVVGLNQESQPELAPSCVSASGEAAPGVRMQTFLSQFPQRNTITTICNENLENALVLIAQLLAKVIGNPCLDGNMTDYDPAAPGIQPECQVSDVRYPDTDRQEEYPMPSCDNAGGTYPCWRLNENPTACPDTETNLELIVERDSEPPTGTHVQARCVVE